MVDAEPFLLISVSTAGGTSGLRVTVWRNLRALGALYLQQSVCLLPAREEIARQVRRLIGQVLAKGGTGQVLTVTLDDPRELASVVDQFNVARDAEYGEILERTPPLLAELAAGAARGRVTYAEVEESEAELERFRTWIAKIAARDYFGATGRAEAEAAVVQFAEAVAKFEAAAVPADAS
ncbi:Chromate resistance protein ChrB [Dactylosporangium sp. CS-033363]|uniref:Chromate resistance protein ChrB n=1 Tax=Dactylosporangium sp. CS-033363 TaxID=3239935 RepID=UPI003D8A7F81